MATFVLVHGGFGGGWAFRDVAGLLRTAGHDVFTPTLTGLGERVHLANPEVDLETHIQDVINVLIYEELTEVVLYGHSYGGMVITGVADRAPERIAHLVYGDAFLPRDGEASIDLTSPEIRAGWRALAAAGEWRVPRMAGILPRSAPQPLRTLLQPLRLAGRGATLPRTFIHATSPPHPGVIRSAERARSEPGWRLRELSCSHSMQWEMPRQLTDLLIESAAGTSP